ncbi:MAG: flavodoxin-dependent (E)-4-hydroxy-3-methylbut-2-enyl-diphosphate synthase [Planctomycetota bacterium]|jgi:(E)-4-hydroxy-3-methylbut-2-enyl-diphosphate synthase
MIPPDRKNTTTVQVRGVAVGGCQPIVVQSMTNTDTADAESTAEQVAELYQAGSELVRITVNNKAAASKVPEIRSRLMDKGLDVPLVGDFHFNGHVLLREFPDCAETLDKYRINPGNVGRGERRDENFSTMIEVAKEYDRPVRIGVNAGSLDPELLTEMMDANNKSADPEPAERVLLSALVESAVSSSRVAMDLGLPAEKIILSCKISSVQELITVYRDLSKRSSLPLHLGLTEAGMGTKGVVSTTAALAVLLQQGIGDTIRVSLTPPPGGSRSEEVRVARAILQAMGIRPFMPEVTACPGCGRTTSSYFQELSQEVERFLGERMPEWRKTKPQAAKLKVAVMGCVVNGPGESRAANIGISLPGTGEAPRSPVYIDGEHRDTLEGPELMHDFKRLIEEYVGQM